MKLFKKAKKGFTLVELVVVIAVIAILAAVSVGAYFGVTESAKKSQVEQEAKGVHTAITLIANDPDTLSSMTNAGFTKGTDFNDDLTRVAGITYTVVETKGETDFNAKHAVIVLVNDDQDTAIDKFEYWIDKTHGASFDIVTGAKTADLNQYIVAQQGNN